MHTCISSHGLKGSWRSCPRRVNTSNKKHTQHAPSTKTECDYLNGWIKKRSHTQKSHPKVVIPRDIAGERKKNPNPISITLASFTDHTSTPRVSSLSPHLCECECVCVCVCVCVYVCMRTNTCACMHTCLHLSACTCACMHTCLHLSVSVFIYIDTHTRNTTN